jgi:hypothetical protein
MYIYFTISFLRNTGARAALDDGRWFNAVMPAKADIEPPWAELDSRFRGNDKTTGCDSI